MHYVINKFTLYSYKIIMLYFPTHCVSLQLVSIIKLTNAKSQILTNWNNQPSNFWKARKTHSFCNNTMITSSSYSYLFLRHIFYKPDSTKLDFPMDSIHILYFIYFFKHGPSPCDNMGELRKCGLEGMG